MLLIIFIVITALNELYFLTIKKKKEMNFTFEITEARHPFYYGKLLSADKLKIRTQNSINGSVDYLVNIGDSYTMEVHGFANVVEIGGVYNCRGSWVDFYKTGKIDGFVYCVTDMQKNID
jgi:hypothetical protein